MTKHEETGALTEATFYILLSLHEPMHGYAIMQNVQSLTNGRVSIGAGTLYGALNLLVEKGWIRGVEGGSSSRRKEYEITKQGRRVFQDEVDRLASLIADAKTVKGEN